MFFERDNALTTMLTSLRLPKPSLPVRLMLIAEVLVFLSAVAGCIWTAPHRGQSIHWYHVALWTLAVMLPVGANLLHGDRLADSGLRLDNIGVSARQVAVASIILAAGVIVIGLAVGGFHMTSFSKLGARAGEYLAVAFLQQYVLQAFVLRRFCQAGLAPRAAVFAAAVVFAAIHAPNWVLMGATCFAAIVWCSLFLRRPNLLTLAVSHGLLALMLYHFWPNVWHLRLTVGPKALKLLAG